MRQHATDIQPSPARVCIVADCVKRLRSDNRSGYCTKHRNRSPARRDYSRRHMRKVRGSAPKVQEVRAAAVFLAETLQLVGLGGAPLSGVIRTVYGDDRVTTRRVECMNRVFGEYGLHLLNEEETARAWRRYDELVARREDDVEVDDGVEVELEGLA